jgi:hypothetical protein
MASGAALETILMSTSPNEEGTNDNDLEIPKEGTTVLLMHVNKDTYKLYGDPLVDVMVVENDDLRRMMKR